MEKLRSTHAKWEAVIRPNSANRWAAYCVLLASSFARRNSILNPHHPACPGWRSTMAFRFEKLTLKSQEAVQKAQDVARDKGHQRLEPIHLLMGLLDPDQSVVRSLSRPLGTSRDQLRRAAQAGLDSLPKVSGGGGDLKL